MKNEKQYTEYDEQAFFNATILPLLKQIKVECKINKIPFFFTCAPTNKKNKTKYYTDGVLSGSSELELYDDRFEDFLLLMNGGHVTVKKDDISEEVLVFPDIDDDVELSEEDIDVEKLENITFNDTIKSAKKEKAGTDSNAFVFIGDI